MKQTAVEWLIRELCKHRILDQFSLTSDPVASAILEAKQMEEEQSKAIPQLSDKEIRELSNKAVNENYWMDQQSWVHGAIWYREQLKQRQCNKQQ